MKVVLIVGPPRSGTSVTARILHEKLGVCMGHNLVPGNEGNPKGFYEDFKYVDIIKRRKHAELHDALDHGCELVGAKSPELAFMNFEHLSADIIFRCRRPIHMIAESLVRWKQPRPTLDMAVEIAKNYESQLDLEIQDLSPWKSLVWNVFYPRYRPEEDIEEELKFALCL